VEETLQLLIRLWLEIRWHCQDDGVTPNPAYPSKSSKKRIPNEAVLIKNGDKDSFSKKIDRYMYQNQLLLVYVCTYVCMHACMYVYMYVGMYICTYVSNYKNKSR
jgi:hypothetical protein